MQKIDKWKLDKLVANWQPRRPLKTALIKWFCASNAEFNYFVTLTYKREVRRREQVEKHCRYFANRFNASFGYGKFYKRVKHDKSKQAQMITVIEGDGLIKRYHVHLFLYKPETMPLATFVWKVNRCWYFATDQRSSYMHNDYRPITCFVGLADYLTKEIKSTDIDALHVGATHVH